VRRAYLAKDFKTLYAQFSSDDQKKVSYAKFAEKTGRYYKRKVDKFRQLQFVTGKTVTDRKGRRFHEFFFKVDGRKIKGGRMLREASGWRLYRFR
jgi:hypothetical protein